MQKQLIIVPEKSLIELETPELEDSEAHMLDTAEKRVGVFKRFADKSMVIV